MIEGKCHCCKCPANIFIVVAGKQLQVCNKCRNIYKLSQKIVRGW